MRHSQRGLLRAIVGAAVAALVLAGPCALPVALAVAPLGACCLSNGACVDELAFVCEGQGGSFIGAGTSCSTIDCTAPVAAPMLSIFGVVAAVGALAGLGVYRLIFPRRRA